LHLVLEMVEALLTWLLVHSPWYLALHTILVHHHLLCLRLLLGLSLGLSLSLSLSLGLGLGLGLSLGLKVDRLLKIGLVLGTSLPKLLQLLLHLLFISGLRMLVSCAGREEMWSRVLCPDICRRCPSRI
jgi:ABC-type dipeptide/oligopeptide/nickel transport system permease component